MSGSTAAPVADASAGSASKTPAVPLEELPGLTELFEEIAKDLAQRLRAYARYPTEWSLAKPRAHRLFEALLERRGGSVAILSGADGAARAYAAFDEAFAARFIDAAFGLKGAAPAVQTTEEGGRRTASKTAPGFLKIGAEASAAAFSAALGAVTPLSFLVERVEAIGETLPRDLHDAEAISAQLEIQAPPTELHLTLIFLRSMLEPLREDFAHKAVHADAPPPDPHWTRRLSAAMSLTPLQVFAVMEDLEFSLGELAELRVGQVLPLAGSGMGKIRLVVEGRDMFWCRLTPNADAYALQIDEAASAGPPAAPG